jgi:hypothetical protein
MSRCRRRARPAYPVVLLFVLALVPLGGAAVPITGAGVDQALSAELGGGLSGGSNCLGAPSCSDSKTNLGPVPLAIPLWSGISADISSNAGSNSVGAGASARASLSEPDELLLDLYPDVVLVGAIRAGAWLRDSKSTSFHTWASASVSSDDFLQFAVPSLLAGESFLMDVGLTSFSASLTTLFSG